MVPAIRTVVVALAVALLGIAACRAQGAATSSLEATGAWRIVSVPGTGPGQEDYALATDAIDPGDVTFRLVCKSEGPLYLFEVKDARRIDLQRGEDVGIALRPENQDTTRFLVASAGGGSVAIQERIHQTAFALVLASLLQSGVATFELSVGTHRSKFSLDGFAGLMEALIKRCGFAPDGSRARGRG